ncbi:MAG TPA: D-aminoacyl-tRNA deacylase [Mesorhizobium sp.]|jgi:D-tyrosyl-tRNA(Tyr) deacylase|uniref:D-aminoacyl-tRNA deacylase n=1 Tax=Mesorhizobium sp. TaxID=1871066 RepID=UPI002DDCCA69|nr:D-aminoacyl-tRNA deacylase [Mesorhizobium sp.]HEV2506444.1 D-aminoacyl-tRNA deacylase [Mesorhizobium sp.]
MRALIQRVSSASVTTEAGLAGQIENGLLIFVCAMRGDTERESDWLARKIANLRIFRDDADRMNRSLLEIGGAALVVSQFTLAAETKGNRPGFSTAAPPEEAQNLYEDFSDRIRSLGIAAQNGVFGANMKVALVNDGPVTIWLDTQTR